MEKGETSARRRGRLHNHVLATAAAIFGPADDQPRWHDIETFACVFANPMQHLPATPANRLDAYWVTRKRSAIHAATCLLHSPVEPASRAIKRRNDGQVADFVYDQERGAAEEANTLA